MLLRFWTSRIVTIKSVNNPQAKLGLVLEEEVTAPSVPKSDKRVEFGLGLSDELLRTSLMAVWELMRPSWCPSPNADSILRATQDVQRELNADCNLRDLNIILNVMITASRSNGEDKVELPGWGPEDCFNVLIMAEHVLQKIDIRTKQSVEHPNDIRNCHHDELQREDYLLTETAFVDVFKQISSLVAIFFYISFFHGIRERELQ